MYKAAILGLGDIAWRYDAGSTDACLTHYSTYRNSKQVEIVGGYDPDAKARSEFQHHTGAQVFSSIDNLLDLAPDVVSITSPTAFHASQLTQCLTANVPMIWLEKPAAANAVQLRELIDLQKTHTATRVQVGFQRRFSAVFQKIREQLAQGSHGTLKAINITYSRTLLTNGIHLLDVMFFLLENDQLIDINQQDTDGVTENPSFSLRFASGVLVQVLGLDLPFHSIDICLHCSEGRIQILHGGLTHIVEKRCDNPLFPGFEFLDIDAECSMSREALSNDNRNVFGRLLDDLICAHETNRQPLSNLHTSLHAQQLVEHILKPST